MGVTGDLLLKLIYAGAEVNKQNSNGNTALMLGTFK